MKNPVAKNMNEFCKPKTFRNRKKEHKLGEEKRDHPKHQPYEREDKAELLNTLLGDWDAS